MVLRVFQLDWLKIRIKGVFVKNTPFLFFLCYNKGAEIFCLLNFMKKLFFRKCVSFLLLLFLITPEVSLAAYDSQYYRTEKENKNPQVNILTKLGSSTIINRSDKDFFVPNNTATEYTAWSKNAPNYVTVSVCGDGVCSEGEDNSNCSQDCLVFDDGYCGDGICSDEAIEIF